MEITPFNILLLMKLDDITGLLVFIGLVITFIVLIAYGSSWARYDSFVSYPRLWSGPEPTVPQFKSRMFILGVILFSLGFLIPTSKQAAVAFVVPSVVKSEFITKDIPAETKELYGLAKEWLKNAVTEREAKSSK